MRENASREGFFIPFKMIKFEYMFDRHPFLTISLTVKI